jgi:hypothetical protein
MKIKKILLFFMLIIPIICKSQITDSLNIRKDSICIGVDTSKMLYCLFYEIENRSGSVLYLWIEKDIHSSEREKIRDYFMKNKGDMSVYQMAMETEITFGCRAIFGTFLKKIKSLEKFTIQIVSTEELSELKKSQIFKYLDEHIVTISETKLEQYIAGLDNFNPLLFYRYNFVTLPVNMIDF